jgi:hypothetical protein
MALTKARPAAGRITEAILGFLSEIPTTSEPLNPLPNDRARHIASAAARKACTISGALALPPGPAGLLTILPDLVAVWRVQAQMVADIAGAFGKSAALSREQMLYCLFKHTAAQAVRDLVVRAGERYLVRSASVRVVQRVAGKVGVKVTQRAIATSVSRWLPVVGIVGVAGYAYYDTAQVGATAIAFFEKPVVADGGPVSTVRPRCGPLADGAG